MEALLNFTSPEWVASSISHIRVALTSFALRSRFSPCRKDYRPAVYCALFKSVIKYNNAITIMSSYA